MNITAYASAYELHAADITDRAAGPYEKEFAFGQTIASGARRLWASIRGPVRAAQRRESEFGNM